MGCKSRLLPDIGSESVSVSESNRNDADADTEQENNASDSRDANSVFI